MKAKVTIYPRTEVLDPQGKAIRQALVRLGFDGVSDVRVGKVLDIEIKAKSTKDAASQAESMCRQLLANEVLEEYEIELFTKTGKRAK